MSLPEHQTERDIVGWPNVPTVGAGVWINERLKFHVRPDVHIRDYNLIYPVSARPKNWRENRALIVSRVQEVIPAANLSYYRGGVAHLETSESTITAYVSGYDATWRRQHLERLGTEDET